MNTFELVKYYADLLILQYIGKPRANATIKAAVAPVVMPQVSVQTITFPLIPDAGSFILSWEEQQIAAINWNDSTATIQTKLRELAPFVYDGGTAAAAGLTDVDGGDAGSTGPEDINGGDAYGFGLSALTVTGSIAAGTLVVTFIGTTPPASLLTLISSTLTSGATAVTPVITEIDETLPLAVQNAFNVIGSSLAKGVQLDVIGKYAGVTRTADGFTTQITLNDADFTTLIQLAIIKNNAGSSLATIQQLLFQFFPAQILVVDYADMFIAYYISSIVGSPDLVELVVTEGLLPKPMGVGEIIVLFDGANAFGFEGSTDSGGFGDATDSSIGGEFASLFA